VANMGEQTGQPAITRAMKLAQGPFFIVSPKLTMGLAWQRVTQSGMEIIDKNGGLTGTSTYIGFLPGYKIGVVLMTNKGKAKSTGIGRQLLFELAGKKYEGGDEEDDQED
jgi:hypothetical protein